MYSSPDYSIKVTVVNAFVSVVVHVVVRVSLRLVLSVNSLLTPPDSQPPKKPPVRVSLSLVLSLKFSCIDTRLSQATNKPLLRCHLGWSCLLDSLVLTPDSHRLLTRLC